jgi:hypothetical protein
MSGHSPVKSPTGLLVAAIVLLCFLVSAGPTLVALLDAAVPLVIVGGIVVAVLRLVFFHTRKW